MDQETLRVVSGLSRAWSEAKHAERKANLERVDIEKSIIGLIGMKAVGAQTIDAGDWKVTVTGKNNVKMDFAKWDAIKDNIPVGMHPLKVKTELDEAALKVLKETHPALYAIVSQAITTTPTKPSVECRINETKGAL